MVEIFPTQKPQKYYINKATNRLCYLRENEFLILENIAFIKKPISNSSMNTTLIKQHTESTFCFKTNFFLIVFFELYN